MYEIDTNIKLLDPINRNLVNYGDFIQASIQRKYTTIVGNPPYVKKSTGNLYIEFIEKCFNLLDNNGELIFIIPSDFFKLTSAARLLNNMLSVGNFTHINLPQARRHVGVNSSCLARGPGQSRASFWLWHRSPRRAAGDGRLQHRSAAPA